MALALFAGGMSWRLLNRNARWPLSLPTQWYHSHLLASDACAACHQREASLWRTSHHKLAMDHATEKSVLGEFSDAAFNYYGI
jgi:hypothetical protein